MLLKRSLSMYTLADEPTYDKRSRQGKNTSQIRICQVCADKASIINYGALSCQSCKTFFRRNGYHPQNIRHCLHNSSCEINIDTRRTCAACRLAKCFSVGMSSDLIRKEEPKERKYSSSPSQSNINKCTRYNQITPTVQIWKSDFLHDNQFLLVTSEEKILSNVANALAICSAVPEVRRIIQAHSDASFNLHFNRTSAFEINKLIYTSIRSFITCIPDFQILTVNEQCSLLERNLGGIVALYTALVFREAGVLNYAHCIKSFVSIYGLEMMVEAIRINKQLDLDFKIIELMLLILAFSSNSSLVNNQQGTYNDSLLFGTHRLLGSQNVYAEVLWKYMVFQYGYYQAAIRFAGIIKIFLDLTKYSADAYMNNGIYHNLVNNSLHSSKQSVITNQNESVQLWGTK